MLSMYTKIDNEVIIAHGLGNIRTRSGEDVILKNSETIVSLINNGENWIVTNTEPVESEYKSRTIEIDAGMSESKIFGIISRIGRRLMNGAKITIQFAAGTYNLSGDIKINGFYGNGEIAVVSGLGVAQINSSGQCGITILRNSVKVTINEINISSNSSAICILDNNSPVLIIDNILSTNGISGSERGLECLNNASMIEAEGNYFNNFQYAIYSEFSQILSGGNTAGLAGNLFSFYVSNASILSQKYGETFQGKAITTVVDPGSRHFIGVNI
jgi:hypothetical protein